MSNFISLDIETNFNNEVMSIGIAVGDKKTFELVDKRYYVIPDAWKVGGIFADPEYMKHEDGYVTGTRTQVIKAIQRVMEKYHTLDIFAYNASFDKSHLPELTVYYWHDIMALCAYQQFNRKIPKNAELCKTGRLKKNYGVEPMMRLFGEKNYTERHNALQDAIDELCLMKYLNLPMYYYYTYARI